MIDRVNSSFLGSYVTGLSGRFLLARVELLSLVQSGKTYFALLWLKTLTIVAGRLTKMLGAVTAEIRERREVHRIGYLSERQAFVIQIVF